MIVAIGLLCTALVFFAVGYFCGVIRYREKYLRLTQRYADVANKVNHITNLIRSTFPEIDADLDDNKPGEV